MDGVLAGPGPQVQGVTGSAALEAVEQVPAQVRREGAVFAAWRWFMERTLASYLIASAFDDDKAEQVQDLGHGDLGTQSAKVDARHDVLPTTTESEKWNPYVAAAYAAGSWCSRSGPSTSSATTLA